MKTIILILLVSVAGYLGFQKFVRNPDIEAGNLKEVIVYGKYGEQKKATFLVEIADDPFERQKGLMYREELPADQGMLFVFKRDGKYSMWMKNTPISLDMIFIDNTHRVVDVVTNTTPNSEQTYGGDVRCSYVLELNAGTAEEYGITKGNVAKGLSGD